MYQLSGPLMSILRQTHRQLFGIPRRVSGPSVSLSHRRWPYTQCGLSYLSSTSLTPLKSGDAQLHSGSNLCGSLASAPSQQRAAAERPAHSSSTMLPPALRHIGQKVPGSLTRWCIQKRALDFIGNQQYKALTALQGQTHVPSLHAANSPEPKIRKAAGTTRPRLDHLSATSVEEARSTIKNYSTTPSEPAFNDLPLATNTRVFVDAALGWGIGLCINNHWLAWQFHPANPLKLDKRGICWAELAAIELAVRYLAAAGAANAQFLIHSDNTFAVRCLNTGKSRFEQAGHHRVSGVQHRAQS